jgi:RHS repeat-associated protein
LCFTQFKCLFGDLDRTAFSHHSHGVFDSFGNAQVTLAEITNNLRLSGQYFDQETGLHYSWNRYYDPAIGRYLRVDPLGDGLS